MTMRTSVTTSRSCLLLEAFCLAAILMPAVALSDYDPIYGYQCQNSQCRKVELRHQADVVSLPVCRLFCGDAIGTLLPKPTGAMHIEPYTLAIDWAEVRFEVPVKQLSLWRRIEERFARIVLAQVANPKELTHGGYPLTVVIHIPKEHHDGVGKETPQLTLDTDEGYKLSILMQPDKSSLRAEVRAATFFGARHGVETLSQLIVYDDIRHELQVVARAEITDRPRYKWRGLLLDTVRNYYSVKAIKRTLDAMAMVKLNTFHWHITGSHSFPMQLKSHPQLSKLGAYKQSKVYTHEQITDIVEYGRVRGIRVMPEFDAPAHVGEGWQHMNMTACFKAQPWQDFCREPPCGQLDPTIDQLYNVLEDIYREIFELFRPDVFHMGGDDVSLQCWNSSERIRTWMNVKKQWPPSEESFMRLWGYFQEAALARVDRVSRNRVTPIILWSSPLTQEPYLERYIDKKRYIIQSGDVKEISELVLRGYRVIVSQRNSLYFHCGGGVSMNGGANKWCLPYIGWQKVYDNHQMPSYNRLVLGAEGVVWSHRIDELTLDSRLWPRASALAESLWSQPAEGWRAAESRMLLHRERLVQNRIQAEPLQPEWCLQNEGQCPKSLRSGAGHREQRSSNRNMPIIVVVVGILPMKFA